VENPRRRVVPLLVVCCIAILTFSRTPGADSVRWVQILLLFAAGMCAGVALASFPRNR
jgi:EamA domain-containing membrane protein RarD